MSLIVTLNGQNFIIPQTNEVGWGSNLDDYFVAIPAGVLQKTGGLFTLSAETDFGSAFGLKSLYYKSRTSNIAATGILRLANNSDAISFRNAANSADLAITVNASNQLCFNGTPIEANSLTSAHILVGNGSNVATDVAMSGDIGIDNTGATTIQAGVVTSAKIAAATIVNSNISASAAIAYSKLTLSNSVVNADINSAAAIAITKLTVGTANQVLGTNAGASANEFKTLTATANQVSVTHGVGTVTFATPQDIGTASAVQFGSLTLGGALDSSSILSLTSTTKGFLPPKMTTTQRNAISSPTDGLVVFDSTLAQLYLRTGGTWTPLSTGGGSGVVSSGTQYQLAYYTGTGTTVGGATLITASKALVSDSNGLPVASTITATELGYVSGVTSAIQTQFGTKAPIANAALTGTFAVNTTDINVDSSHRVGIGITPATGFNLTVQNVASNYGIKVVNGTEFIRIGAGDPEISSSGGTFQIRTLDSNIIQLQTNSLTALTLDASQNAIFGAKIASNIQFNSTSTQGIVGTTTNDSAATGNVGETVLGNQTTFINFPTSTQWGDLTSIALTAGDWLVWGTYQFLNAGGTTTEYSIAVTTTTGNSTTGFVNGLNNFQSRGASLTGTNDGQLTVSAVRLSLSGSATAYLKYEATWTTTAPTASGNIRALRIR